MTALDILEELPSLDFSDDWKELLRDGHITYKYPKDGFLDFHSIKMCSSNGKSLSHFFKHTMGLTEVAYKGLETGNFFLTSHVLSNGKFFIEVVSPLHGIDPERTNYPAISKPAQLTIYDTVSQSVIPLIDREIDSFVELFGAQFEIDRKLVKRSVLERVFQLTKVTQDVDGQPTPKFTDLAIKLTMERLELVKIQQHILKHGDSVYDISMKVENIEYIYNKCVNNGGGIPIFEPCVQTDGFGSCIVAVVGVPDTDIQHTLVQNVDFDKEMYLPGFKFKCLGKSGSLKGSDIDLVNLDHCVFNFTWNQMMDYAKFYADSFGFHKYWSVDEEDVSTGNTSLKSIVMASSNGKVKIPINEPGEGKKRGQIEEFYDFNEGPGIQHIAIRTMSIIKTVESLCERGVEFNSMSTSYYENLRYRLKRDDVVILEDLDELERLNILVDYDPKSRNKKTNICNYILQIFTKPFSDRPTLFFEIIQRRHHNGFGKGTFKGLFESIEAQQISRGTLIDRS